MLNPKNVVGLSKGDEEVASKVEAFIDAQVTEQNAADEKRRSFNVNRAEMVKSAGVDVLTLKVKNSVLDKARKAGWDVTETDTEYVLTAPLPKRGGRPKGSKNVKVVSQQTTATIQTDATPEVAPVVESPAEPVTA